MSYEYVGNMHIHTPYSDGTDYHTLIAEAARQAGLDFIVVTDHNVLVKGVEGYYGSEEDRYVLLLTGEEIHDRTRLPQVNHLLVYGVDEELCHLGDDPQVLIDAVNTKKGLTFIAHPYDQDVVWVSDDFTIAIPWADWQVNNFTGLEIWNYMSSFKDAMPNVREGMQALFRPDEFVTGPPTEVLAKWDELLTAGQKVIGIGNSDAHGTYFHVGPFSHRVFAYDFLFNCINTHLLCKVPFSGNLDLDRQLIFATLKAGRAFIGYEIPGDTRGFRFLAQGSYGTAEMGDTLRVGSGVTMQIRTPARAHIKIIHEGKIVREDVNTDALTYTATERGAYRVEAWKEYAGKDRCWILSNPIYLIR
ncbi:MAG: CehA/McbA family metallohydrolase [Anaerolineae bacterium]|nr:CehA/McbA family metallohydrolase [Anaerolineae bacterium]